jgi:hypothetical protein
MSITPTGGWRPQEGRHRIVLNADPEPSAILLHTEKKSGSAFGKAFFGCLGAICAVVFVIFVLGVIGKLASDQSGRSTPASPSGQETVRVTAPILNAEYQANEVAADEKYANKSLRVFGQVKSIEKDAWGSIHIRISDDALFSGSLLGVDATLHTDSTNEGIAADLRRGQGVAVLCNKVRYVVGTVMLENCSFDLNTTAPRSPPSTTEGNDTPYSY